MTSTTTSTTLDVQILRTLTASAASRLALNEISQQLNHDVRDVHSHLKQMESVGLATYDFETGTWATDWSFGPEDSQQAEQPQAPEPVAVQGPDDTTDLDEPPADLRVETVSSVHPDRLKRVRELMENLSLVLESGWEGDSAAWLRHLRTDTSMAYVAKIMLIRNGYVSFNDQGMASLVPGREPFRAATSPDIGLELDGWANSTMLKLTTPRAERLEGAHASYRARSNSPKRRVESKVLSLLQENPQGMRVSDLAEQTGVTTHTIRAILNANEDKVEQDGLAGRTSRGLLWRHRTPTLPSVVPESPPAPVEVATEPQGAVDGIVAMMSEGLGLQLAEDMSLFERLDIIHAGLQFLRQTWQEEIADLSRDRSEAQAQLSEMLQADALRRSTPDYLRLKIGSERVWECSMDGILVSDPELHTAWHQTSET